MQEERFEGYGGVMLSARIWRPDSPPRALVILIHGFKAHSGLYQWTAEQMVKQGLAVYALDLRGHGKSEGERYFSEDFNFFVRDVEVLVALARARESDDLPMFVLGHSAGGVIGCIYTLEHQAEVSGFICESFAHQVPAPDFALSVIKGLSHIAPHAHILDLKNKLFSRDPAVVAALDTDPLIPQINYPALTVAGMVRADERLKVEFPLFTLPLLILHGSADAVTVPAGSQRFYDQASSADKTLKMYEGHAHDLLADVGKEGVMADILGFITTRIPA